MSGKADLQAHNMAVFMERGPSLNINYGIWIDAVDLEVGAVRLGGLGAFGIGTMWSWFTDDPRFYPLLDSAPEDKCYMESPGRGSPETLAHWRDKAARNEYVTIACLADEDPTKEGRCGLTGPVPDDRVPADCRYCHGPIRVVGPAEIASR